MPTFNLARGNFIVQAPLKKTNGFYHFENESPPPPSAPLSSTFDPLMPSLTAVKVPPIEEYEDSKPAEAKRKKETGHQLAVSKLKNRCRDLAELGAAVALMVGDTSSWTVYVKRGGMTGAENMQVIYQKFGMDLFPLASRATSGGREALHHLQKSFMLRRISDVLKTVEKGKKVWLMVAIDAHLWQFGSSGFDHEQCKDLPSCRLLVTLV